MSDVVGGKIPVFGDRHGVNGGSIVSVTADQARMRRGETQTQRPAVTSHSLGQRTAVERLRQETP